MQTINSFLSLEVLSGIIISIIGFLLVQFFEVFFLAPYREWRTLRAKIASNLQFYANIYSNLGGNAPYFIESYFKMNSDFRSNAGEITAYYINHKQFFRSLYAKDNKLKKVSKSLILMSNLTNNKSSIEDSIQTIKEIELELGLK